MARTRPQGPTSNALIASAVSLPGAPQPAQQALKERGWQKAAWNFYDTIGEFRFAAEWTGNLLSRAVLFATKDDGSGPKKVAEGDPADEVLDELFGSVDGKQRMLQQVGVHFTVPGEVYLVGWEDEDGQHWRVSSASDMKSKNGRWVQSKEVLPEDATVIHMWTPHPRKYTEPTSPARAALPILSEIERLTMHLSAQVDSRLSSAGILWIPNEIAVAAAGITAAEGGTEAVSTAQAFVQNLQQVAATAIANREDASALVPIVVTADGEYIDKVKHTTFWSPLDENTLALRQAAVKRLALSLDLPPEVLTGLGDSNHWSAWQVDESSVKAHAEPLLARICSDLAQGWLRPAMIATGAATKEDALHYGVSADTSEMRLRPNRSKEAMELWDRGVLGDVALLRETGFDVSDAPKDDGLALWLTRKIASGSTTPEQVAAAARILGVDLPADSSGAEPTEARPTPSLLDHPVREIPDEPSAALLAAAEQMVFRALERAGNRLRSATGVRPEGVSASEVYMFVPCGPGRVEDVLTDAWSHVDRFAPSLGVDPEWLSGVLDSYCRVLIVEQQPHDPDLMRRYLSIQRVAA